MVWVLKNVSALKLSAEIFLLLLVISTFVTIGIRARGNRSPRWQTLLNAVYGYYAVMAYEQGVYLRRNSSEPNFIFLPWNTVTGISVSGTRGLVFSVSPTAEVLLGADEQLARDVPRLDV